jgi:TolB-like protein
MRYRFDQFELDTHRYSLRGAGADIHVEPLVFDLLRCFVENAGEVLTRDEIIQRVWQGRFVSDATVSSCIKSARRALGDSGESQTYIRTIRGRGFQFVASIASAPASATAVAATAAPPEGAGDSPISPPPRIAVLPFFPLSLDPEDGLLGDALAQEVILEISRLHWLFVIARASSFKFRGQEVDLARAGEILGADYLLTGAILRQNGRILVSVELCRAADRNIVWAEHFTSPADAIMHMGYPLAAEIARALEPRIQHSEALRAARTPTDRLDAWAAYHRGLWHMFRFNAHDNRLATDMFTHALGKDPGFARAHAGLSFTHFQNAFLGYSRNTIEEREATRLHALKGLELDPLDPFVNLTMGRADWLSGDLESSAPWIERAISLNPNFALAIYNSALVGTLIGDGESNEPKIVRAIALSPIDPMNYAMLATRALTHTVRGEHMAAVEWADRAVRAPNAHVQIYAIAAVANELVGRRSRAAAYMDAIQRLHPGYCKSDFTQSFPFRNARVRVDIDSSLSRLGL